MPIVTTGDVVTGDLARFGGKGLFTQELESGLLDGSLDLAVHSLKDLPVSLPAGLAVAAYPPRADPRDVLVSEIAEDLDGLPAGAVVLTGALRRRAQILMRRPDLRVEPLRGNVDTRLRKWRETGAGGVILAGAGLDRLGLTGLPAHPIAPEVLLPAPGQGTLALETREGSPAFDLCHALDDAATARAADAERRVVAAFGGDCTLPLAAWARPEGDRPPPDRPPRHPGRPPRRPRRGRRRDTPQEAADGLRGGDAGGRGGRGAGADPGVRDEPTFHRRA